MDAAEAWYICHLRLAETVRAVGLSAGVPATATIRDEWPAFAIVEVDQPLVEHAATHSLAHDLRSLDALHLAAALLLPTEDLVLATWDRRLQAATRAEGLAVLPEPPD